MKRLPTWFPTLALVLLASVTSAAGSVTTVGDSTVKFEAVGPAGLKINGTGVGLKAVEADGKITLTAPTTELHTGIGLRDRHLREYLEVDKHSTAALVVERGKITLPPSGKADGTVPAFFTLHGVTKPIKVAYTITRGGADYHVEGTFDVNILEHGIKKPCYLGVCVRDVVKVAADFKVKSD